MTTQPWDSLTIQSDDDLWALLGAQTSRGAGPRDPKFLIVAARAWFKDHTHEFRAAICNNADVLQIWSAASSNEAIVAAAVCDVLAPLFGLPPAATASVLIARQGIDQLCHENS